MRPRASAKRGLFIFSFRAKKSFEGSPSHIFHRKQSLQKKKKQTQNTKNQLALLFLGLLPIFKHIFGLFWLSAFLSLGREIELVRVMRSGDERETQEGFAGRIKKFPLLVGLGVQSSNAI